MEGAVRWRTSTYRSENYNFTVINDHPSLQQDLGFTRTGWHQGILPLGDSGGECSRGESWPSTSGSDRP
ncbi:unnamed protein product [Arabidopsis lyrata]|nr:unnamed protein product [Arabidopsis lyrata]